jgi:hypothetical protein
MDGAQFEQRRAATTLTTSGNEVTDTTRAQVLTTTSSGQMMDGRTNDSSFGIRRAATNLFRRGQCDSVGTAGIADSLWNSGGGGAVNRTVDATVPAPFSPQSIKNQADGLAASQSSLPQTATTLGITGGPVVVGSLYFLGVAGQSYFHRIRVNYTDATSDFGTSTVFTATGSWQLVIPLSVTSNATKTIDFIRSKLELMELGRKRFGLHMQ